MSETDEEWLADYLRLEYGEDKSDPSSIKAKDLEYDGEYVIDSTPTKFWKYPTSKGHEWVVIQEYPEGRCADFVNSPPPKN